MCAELWKSSMRNRMSSLVVTKFSYSSFADHYISQDLSLIVRARQFNGAVLKEFGVRQPRPRKLVPRSSYFHS